MWAFCFTFTVRLIPCSKAKARKRLHGGLAPFAIAQTPTPAQCQIYPLAFLTPSLKVGCAKENGMYIGGGALLIIILLIIFL